MSESSFSFTTKVRGDLYTIRGDDADKFLENLIYAATDPMVLQYIETIQDNAAALSPATQTAVSNLNKGGVPTSENKYVCVHGDREYRNGRSAKGEWVAYFCPVKDRDCKPMNADGSLWK